ncbi:DUF4375 domain-containing protein [Chitinophaga filiformis]|uniref:DMP19 family protein n=1 Tax=Chitinophaga filiformis TaxID=104663 RepID=UPI001F45A473|nr:DUF4375 domain-containing protein [Chitinophaga filiformis]MCF6403053.1 DUF4375 domain-containing protein [Chitinophaga filiformis]
MTERAFTFYSLDDGNQQELILAPDYSQQWFDETNRKYNWEEFNAFDNKFWEYTYQLSYPLLEKSVSKELNYQEYFSLLNRGQKIFYCVLMFSDETDNGGVYQFFFNRPEFSFAVLESFRELQLETLARDYAACLDELTNTADSYNKRKERFNNEGKSWEQRWQAFREGYGEMKAAAKIEAYFYDDGFKKELYKTMVDYIERNMSLFVKQ